MAGAPLFYSIGVSEGDVEEGITYNVVAYGLLLRSCRALYSTVVAIITARITLTSSWLPGTKIQLQQLNR